MTLLTIMAEADEMMLRVQLGLLLDDPFELKLEETRGRYRGVVRIDAREQYRLAGRSASRASRYKLPPSIPCDGGGVWTLADFDFDTARLEHVAVYTFHRS